MVLAGVLWTATLSWTSSAVADAPPIPITWDAPASCPSLDDVRGFLDAVVPDEVRSRLEDVRAAVVLTEVAGGYRGDVRVERQRFVGERSVEGRRCDDVARSAIIVISVALTEAVNADVTSPEPESPPTTVAPVDAVVPTPPVGSDVPGASVAERRGVAFGADVSAVSGVASSAMSARVSSFVRFEVSDVVAVGVRLRAMPYARIDGANASGRVAMIGVVPDVCVLARLRHTVRLGGCALLDLSAVVARGTGAPEALRDAAAAVSLGVEPTIEVGDRVRFRVALEGEARVVRPRYVVSGDGTVERTSPLGVGARLGLLVRIP